MVGLLVEETTWEDLPALLQAYPKLNLEDKVSVEQPGNDISTSTKMEAQLKDPLPELEMKINRTKNKRSETKQSGSKNSNQDEG